MKYILFLETSRRPEIGYNMAATHAFRQQMQSHITNVYRSRRRRQAE